MSSEQGGERGFIVVDERGKESATEPAAGGTHPDAGQLPRPDFAALVISLGHSALYHLGVVADPATGQRTAPNYAMARQTIDTIEVLQEKTRGNLTPDEERLLGDLLYDLRAQFLEAKK